MAAHLKITLQLLNLINSMHPSEPHWYLATLGTDPDFQGKGIGSSLLRPVLDHCDAEGWPAYLESSKERNIPFYFRHGFTVVREVPLPVAGPTSGRCGATPTMISGGGSPRAWRAGR